MLLKNSIKKVTFLVILTFLVVFFSRQVSGEDLGGIRSGEVRSSSINPVADSDAFNFYGKAGEGVIISMRETSGSSGFYEYIELYDPDGVEEKSAFNSISNHRLKKTGLYTIVCRTVWNDVTGVYNISFLKIPGPTLSPSDRDGGDIVSGEVLSGQITPIADTDAFNFYGKAGEGVIINMSETSGSSGFYEYIELYDPDGVEEKSAFNSISNYQLKKTGLYTIVCRTVWNDVTGVYNISFTKMPPDLPSGVYNPTPGNGAIVPLTTNLLDWSDAEGASLYDVYFGTDVVEPLEKIGESITVSYYAILLLDNTTYYWKVVAKSGADEIQGPVWTFTAQVTTPYISLSISALNFGATTTGHKTPDQQFRISNTGEGTLDWSITDNAAWLSCTPESGTGAAVITVSVNPSGLAAGTYNGTITVSSTTASNSPQTIIVTLNVYAEGTSSPPFGVFSTPIDGSTVSSSIPVTGWALDDIGVESVKIYRQEGGSLVYIGDSVFVEGARPDVEQAYPGYPNNYKAGWGYMLLTNFLPNGGNGTFSLQAWATDKEGNSVHLGTKTITCDNANAVKPFGAIDTPAQGGTASGSSFLNWGWALTPMPNSIPTDGSTINVFVDSVNIGHPVYNNYREDIADNFPGYANSDGAVGYFYLDTTAYDNGVHTIFWTAEDNAGNADGIGSRYFSIANTGSSGKAQMQGGIQRKALDVPLSFEYVMNLPISYEPIKYKRGFKTDIDPEIAVTDNYRVTNIEIREVERIKILLNHELSTISHEPSDMSYSGYMVVGNQLRPLPIGSTLNAEAGVFSWLPGPGFVGKYDLVFIKKDISKMQRKIIVKINITPKFRLDK